MLFVAIKVSTSRLRPPNRDGYITSQEMVRRSRHLTRDQVHKVSLLVEISDIDCFKIQNVEQNFKCGLVMLNP